MIKSFLPAVALSLVALSAQAQEFVRPDCLSVVRPSAGLTFENPEHRNWYRRFWTGDCRDLPKLRCMPGSPNWNDVVSKLVKKGQPAQAASVTASACRLGQTMGYEWARPKPVRRIDTDDLKSYLAALDSAPDVTTGLTRVDGRVKAALARP